MAKRFPTVPRTLGDWKTGHLLGRGACGGVYVAERDGMKCAIKVVKQRAIVLQRKEVNYASMLARESSLLSKTKHLQIPYLPTLYQAFTVGPDGWYFFAIELFSEGSLYDVVRRRRKPLLSQIAFAVGWRLVNCLRALHHAGWLHLDVKPSNVMVTEDRNRGIALVDFGLALPMRFAKIFPREDVSGAHEFVGSHVWKLERESARDDLEAVGLTMAWMLLGGRLPWSDDEPRMIGEKIQDPDLPRMLGEVCKSAAIEKFISRVRNLGIDDDPEYDQLQRLLEKESGSFLDSLKWYDEEKTTSSCLASPRNAEGVASNSKSNRARRASERSERNEARKRMEVQKSNELEDSS